MGRAPCCDKANVKKGPWSPEEDAKLKSYIEQHGTGGNWIALPQKIGLKRCGKSCRLRWLNYLRPNIKHGGFSEEEDNIICSLYINIGSRWSIIASQLPGRTDNDIKNYWNTRLKKKLFGKQRKERQRSGVATATSILNQEVKGVQHEVGNLGIANTIGTAGQFAYWPQPLAAPVLPLHVEDHVDQASAAIRKLLSKLEGRFATTGATDENHLMHVSSSSMPAQAILDASTSLAPPMQCDKSSQAATAPNLYSTELDEIFRFNSVKVEGLDYFHGIGGITDHERNENYMNWNEVSPLMYTNNMISSYQGLMQQCPIEEPVHLGVQ